MMIRSYIIVSHTSYRNKIFHQIIFECITWVYEACSVFVVKSETKSCVNKIVKVLTDHKLLFCLSDILTSNFYNYNFFLPSSKFIFDWWLDFMLRPRSLSSWLYLNIAILTFFKSMLCKIINCWQWTSKYHKQLTLLTRNECVQL